MRFQKHVRNLGRLKRVGAISLVVGAWLGSTWAASTPAIAHPHVYIDVALEIVIKNGTILGVRHVWTFDDFYSASAVDGLDTNKDGVLTRQELHELAKTNMEGLKEFNYFTFASLAGAEQKVADPKLEDSFHEFKDSKLSLTFFLPLANPILMDAKGISFAVYDPSFFIAFEIKSDARVTLNADAPKSCKLVMGGPKAGPSGTATDDATKLGESFFSALGGGNYGLTLAKSVSVDCGKS